MEKRRPCKHFKRLKGIQKMPEIVSKMLTFESGTKLKSFIKGQKNNIYYQK